MPQLENLDKNDCQVIWAALAELPSKIGYRTMRKIEAQFKAQGLLPPDELDYPPPVAKLFPEVPKD